MFRFTEYSVKFWRNKLEFFYCICFILLVTTTAFWKNIKGVFSPSKDLIDKSGYEILEKRRRFLSWFPFKRSNPNSGRDLVPSRVVSHQLEEMITSGYENENNAGSSSAENSTLEEVKRDDHDEFYQNLHDTFDSDEDVAQNAWTKVCHFILELSDLKSSLPLVRSVLSAIEVKTPLFKSLDSSNWCDNILDIFRSSQYPTTMFKENELSSVLDALPVIADAVYNYDGFIQYEPLIFLVLLEGLSTHQMLSDVQSTLFQLKDDGLMREEPLKKCIIPRILDIYNKLRLAGIEETVDLRIMLVQMITSNIKSGVLTDREWLFKNLLPRYSQILRESSMYLVQEVMFTFDSLARLMGRQFSELFIVPHWIALSYDESWTLRKIVSESLLDIAERVSVETRVQKMTPVLVRLLNDSNQWVSMAAYRALGKFIAMFADSSVTGLELVDGVVHHNLGLPKSGKLMAQEQSDDGYQFTQFAPGTFYRTETDLKNEEVRTIVKRQPPPKLTTPKREQVMDTVLSGLNKMLRTPPKSPKSSNSSAGFFKRLSLSLGSSPTKNCEVESKPKEEEEEEEEIGVKEGVAAKCNSTEDLSKLGLDDEQSAETTEETDLRKPLAPLVSVLTSSSDEDEEEDGDDKSPSPSKNRKKAPPSPGAFNIRQRLFLRRLGALPSSPKRTVKMKVSKPKSKNPRENVFVFDAPKDVVEECVEDKEKETKEGVDHGLSYWSAGYNVECTQEDFNATKKDPISSTFSKNYLESRFDVIQPSPVVSTSPFNESTQLNSDTSLGIFDFDKLSMTSSTTTNAEEVASTPTTVRKRFLSDIESNKFLNIKHVPNVLINCFINVIEILDDDTNTDMSMVSEYLLLCAYNFPAVCYTLGVSAWPRLREAFGVLALYDHPRVRATLAGSMHAIARIIGQELTDRDLYPIFNVIRSDPNNEVRSAIIAHLYEFVECLSEPKRMDVLSSLLTFMPIGAQLGDWRIRCELNSQLTKLCALYDKKDINKHMSGIALTLANDRVAEVRIEAVALVARIVGALVRGEWSEIVNSCEYEKMFANNHHHHYTGAAEKSRKGTGNLSEELVADIVISFANTRKWTRRQTFCFICHRIITDKLCDPYQFCYFFLKPLMRLAKDKVANVRLSACAALCDWRIYLFEMLKIYIEEGKNNDGEAAKKKQDFVLCEVGFVQLLAHQMSQEETDIDVSLVLKKFENMDAENNNEIDVKTRTCQMREREERYFENLRMMEADTSPFDTTLDMENSNDEMDESMESSIPEEVDQSMAEMKKKIVAMEEDDDQSIVPMDPMPSDKISIDLTSDSKA